MLIGVFKSNQKVINGLAVLVLILLWIPAFFSDTTPIGLISAGLRWLDLVLLVFLLSFQAIYLNFIASEYKLVKDNSHLTSLIYVVLNSCFVQFFEFNTVVLANLFVLIALHQLYRLYGSKNNFSISFGAGLLIGLAGLLHFPMFVYFFLLWFVLIYTTTPNWRDFIVSLIGVILPVIYFVSYSFVMEDYSLISINHYINKTFVLSWENVTIYNQLYILGLILVLAIAIFSLFITLGREVVKTSKMLIVVMFMFAIGLISLFLNEYDFLATFLMLTVPLSIIIANFFQSLKKIWIAETMFFYLLVTMVLGYFL